MERDEKGRFLPGNKAAKGNKGNRNPKWNNKNAVKHGFYQDFILAKLREDGNLHLIKRGSSVVVGPTGYIREEDGRIRLRDDIVQELKNRGYAL
jgi:uncharacterized protein YjcR